MKVEPIKTKRICSVCGQPAKYVVLPSYKYRCEDHKS